MQNLYETNGLMFWDQQEIRLRRMFEQHFLSAIERCMKKQNRAFEFFQIEATILTPSNRINPNYTADDVYNLDMTGEYSGDSLTLRPETTMGSYAYADWLLNTKQGIRMPICVWQHGKSFRREQDQPTKFMRLKEFYQQEFQIIYAESTKADYSQDLIPAIQLAISEMIGPCRVEDSDRLPDYSNWTKDIVCELTNMEVCSISNRKDFDGACVLEVAIGTDRCVYNFNCKNPNFKD